MTTRLMTDRPVTWSMDRDERGHRTYKVIHNVEGDPDLDGPRNVMLTPGLPLPGTSWNFSEDGIDNWSFCTRMMKISPKLDKEKNKYWTVEQEFKSDLGEEQKCKDEEIEDPLLEPDQVRGSFSRYQKQVYKDRFGNILRTSSWEPLDKRATEFDHHRPGVIVSQNRLQLGLDVFSQLIDTVNSTPMWGLPVRTVKLSNASWTRKVYGTCNFYYTREFEFEIDYNTWDRVAPDEGSMVLNGEWDLDPDFEGTGTSTPGTGDWSNECGWVLLPVDDKGTMPDPNNPAHFIRYKERHGENSRILLDGFGRPLCDGAFPVFHSIEYYPQADLLLLLDLPASF